MTNHKKGFVQIVFIAIGLIVLVAAVGGSVAVMKKNSGPKTETPAVQNNAGQNNQENFNAETKDWETYTSSENTFQLSYPSSWSVKGKEYPWVSTVDPKIKGIYENIVVSRNNYEVVISTIPETTYGKGAVGSSFTQNFYAISPKDYEISQNEVLPGTFLVRYKGLQFVDEGNQPYFRIFQAIQSAGTYKVPRETPSLVTGSTLYKDKFFYSIYVNVPKELMNRPEVRENIGNAINFIDSKILSEADQIISTFKFIGKSETADWKTYRNEKYGFEFTLQKDWTVKESLQKSEEGVVSALTLTDGKRQVYLEIACLVDDSNFMGNQPFKPSAPGVQNITISGQKFQYFNRPNLQPEGDSVSFLLPVLKKVTGNSGFTNCGMKLHAFSYPTLLDKNVIEAFSTLKFDGGFDAFVGRVVAEFNKVKPYKT